MLFRSKMKLDSSGNLGIGTTSPNSFLHIKGGNNNVCNIDNDGSQYTNISISNNGTEKGSVYWDNTNGQFTLGSNATNSQVLFRANNAERARIDSSGNFMVGTTTNKTTIVTGGATGISIGAAGAPTLAIWDTSDTSYAAFFSQVNEITYLGNVANGSLVFETNAVERARITSDGDVLYNKILYSTNGTSAGGLALYRDHATGSCYLFDTTTAPYSGPLIFGTNNTERARIDGSGKLGIGTTSPAQMLDVRYAGSGSGAAIRFGSASYGMGQLEEESSINAVIFKNTYSTSGIFLWKADTAERARINSSGNLYVGTTSSSEIGRAHV